MKRIHVLDLQTSNKIAAGEVVERPCSVVKEIVENSIDAGAKSITIEIVEGGQKSIKVIDDGMGIHSEDITKAFLPHATSKISEVEDLFKIDTLGFRGEALASIASVSEVLLKSKTSEEAFGSEISITGGTINYIREVGANLGTTIEVNNLFYNVPARQKFLKSTQREAAMISDIISRLALAHNEISFTFTSNEKKLLSTFASPNIGDTIRNIYGKTIHSNIIAFEKHSDVASVYGYIGNAEASRGSRNNQSIFVNKRYIKSKLITAAVENAFKSFLTVNKFPFFILFLDIFPEFIDVNVHPTKSEIKFQNEREIFKSVFDSVHEAIRNSVKNTFDIPTDYKAEVRVEENQIYEKQSIQLPIDLHNAMMLSNPKVESTFSFTTPFKPATGEDEKKKIFFDNKNLEVAEKSIEKKEDNEEVNLVAFKEAVAKFPPLRIIGQYSYTYILAEASDGLYIIDQHAAHEKILFEKYLKEMKEQAVMAQVLITPIVLELSLEDYVYYSENSDIFKEAGFNIEIFGDRTITLREVPILLGKPDVKGLFTSMLENLKALGSGKPSEVKQDALAKIACKAAIKGRDPLLDIEMKALLEELRFIENPFHCPHGRPTIIKMSLFELEKKFKRIQ